MKRERLIVAFLASASVFVAGNAFATTIQYDFGDAVGYETASHSNPLWQQLGSTWDAEAGPQYPDSSDDGVSWSVDGGITYGHDEITAGQTVEFKFDMYKEDVGSHSFDALKVWLDWNQDDSFLFDASDVVLSTGYNYRTEVGPVAAGEGVGVNAWNSFYASVVVPDNVEGTFWMRSRVMCDYDLIFGVDYAGGTYAFPSGTGTQEELLKSMNAYDYYGHGQGEVEDWALTVVAAPVPEPSTMLLFGAGLSALGFYRRKHKSA
ncbi:MAG: PEP-CTERM sorting domain-containing protein [Desulfocapsa sp.]|nr:PEP-CTERM sorting domain-containing protein [Desulfocapsa sp.]